MKHAFHVKRAQYSLEGLLPPREQNSDNHAMMHFIFSQVFFSALLGILDSKTVKSLLALLCILFCKKDFFNFCIRSILSLYMPSFSVVSEVFF